MKNDYWKACGEIYRKELVDNVMPFWIRNGWDRKNGGVYTCLNRDGSLMDSTKSVWFQGRFGWVCAHAYNTVARNRTWLKASESCCRFLDEHCFDPKDGRAYFEISAEGVGLRKRRYVFAECFAAIAYAEYSIASGDVKWAEKAMEMYRRIQRFIKNGDRYMPSKFESCVKTKGHPLTMMLICVANVLKQISDERDLDAQIDRSIDCLNRYLIHPEYKALLETVGENGELIDTLSGRVINPGHCIETAWFLMDVAVARGGDAKLLKTALQILDWSWKWGWDPRFGGIISFKDCRGLPAQSYEQDMKFWWPQCEAIIATAYAYKLTGKAKYEKWHRLVHEWAFSHLKDRRYPEWFGYLHRDGTVAQPAKGNIFKGPFHIPRMLMKAAELTNGL